MNEVLKIQVRLWLRGEDHSALTSSAVLLNGTGRLVFDQLVKTAADADFGDSRGDAIDKRRWHEGSA
jgi:hypothetical protein